jgi:L-alanine-DL-glutamate epimerase-like enolase superfamily enzyme
MRARRHAFRSLRTVLSGIDIALWDAKGKLLRQPVYNLISGKTLERVGGPTYHFLSRTIPHMTPFCEYLDVYRGAAKEWVLTDDPRPFGGWLAPTGQPRFGYRLNEKVFQDETPVAAIW